MNKKIGQTYIEGGFLAGGMGNTYVEFDENGISIFYAIPEPLTLKGEIPRLSNLEKPFNKVEDKQIQETIKILEEVKQKLGEEENE